MTDETELDDTLKYLKEGLRKKILRENETLTSIASLKILSLKIMIFENPKVRLPTPRGKKGKHYVKEFPKIVSNTHIRRLITAGQKLQQLI